MFKASLRTWPVGLTTSTSLSQATAGSTYPAVAAPVSAFARSQQLQSSSAHKH